MSARLPDPRSTSLASRRAVVGAAAWAAPTITVLSAAPSFAASGAGTVTVADHEGDRTARSGSLLLLLTPAPAAALTTGAVTASYAPSTTGTVTTSSFLELSRTGTGATSSAIYRLSFATDSPAPATVVVTGTITGYGAIPSTTVDLTTPGTLDTAFSSGAGLVRGVNGSPAKMFVNAIAVQPDGKVLIGGDFTTYRGVTATGLVRLNPDGSLDSTFNPQGAGLASPSGVTVFGIVVRPDGRIVVGGVFTSYNGTPVGNLVQLTPTGALDTTFVTTGVDGGIQALALYPDGRLLLGGTFSTYDGMPRNGLARALTTGAIDTSLTGTGTGSSVRALAIYPDERILVGGNFSAFNGSIAGKLVRLTSGGVTDSTFSGGGPSGSVVLTVGLTASEQIIVGGSFTKWNGKASPAPHVVRLDPTGAVDTAFAPSKTGLFQVTAVVVQPDGRILMTGGISGGIRRLTADGTTDTGFAVGAGTDTSTGNVLALAPRGRAYVGGDFKSYDGATATGIARIFR